MSGSAASAQVSELQAREDAQLVVVCVKKKACKSSSLLFLFFFSSFLLLILLLIFLFFLLFMTGSMQLKTYEYVLHMNLRLFLLILQSAYWLCSRLELIFASAGPWGIRGGGAGESDFLFYTSVSRHCRIGFSILYLRLSPL